MNSEVKYDEGIFGTKCGPLDWREYILIYWEFFGQENLIDGQKYSESIFMKVLSTTWEKKCVSF